MHSHYAKPAWVNNAQGKTRCAGFELEFAGLDLKTAADALALAVQGVVLKDTQAECKVKHPEYGNFKVELDWSYAKNMARKRLEEQGAGDDGRADAGEDAVMALMTDLARQIVPLEVVCPPVPVTQLSALDTMVDHLREAGALGTSDSLIYAFGVHINTELPAFDAPTLITYLQAYCVSQHWLVKAHKVDAMRRLTPYIDAYPVHYVEKVMNYNVDTTVENIIDDYLVDNPTRNRGMDLLPLFKHIDDARVSAVIKDERVNARPTFHYRLPNCEIERAEWHLSESWNIWCVVEHLAADPATLKSMCEQWALYQNNLINLQEEPWHHELAQIHVNLLSV